MLHLAKYPLRKPGNPGRPKNCLLLALLAATGLCSCNVASHSYNSGKLLDPGASTTCLGYGKRDHYSELREAKTQAQLDSIILVSGGDYRYSDDIPDSIRYTISLPRQTSPSYALQYRLGVLSTKPFGNGLEVGWMLEAPILLEKTRMAFLEFDSRLGLPSPFPGNWRLDHNLAIGWGIGLWVDNTVFVEYALGREGKWLSPYVNVRAIATASHFDGNPPWDDDDDVLVFVGGKWREGRRLFNCRVALGWQLSLPDLPLLPDRIVPEVTAIFPNYQPGRVAGYQLHSGFQWVYQ